MLGVLASGRAPASDGVPVEWQHRKVNFNYVGFTTLYVCDALEDQVSRILVHFGARKDTKVTATCPQGPNVPSRQALVTVDFYVPAPIEGPGTPGTVRAQWTSVLVDARHPSFMGRGDCELMQALKETVTKNFNLQALKYTVSCFPNSSNANDFSITGAVLKVAAAR